MVKNPSVIIPTRPNLIPGILENSALTPEQSSNLVIFFLIFVKAIYFVVIIIVNRYQS